jgi:predicted  nucleic acid-binding Zn-ribbon protein
MGIEVNAIGEENGVSPVSLAGINSSLLQEIMALFPGISPQQALLLALYLQNSKSGTGLHGLKGGVGGVENPNALLNLLSSKGSGLNSLNGLANNKGNTSLQKLEDQASLSGNKPSSLGDSQVAPLEQAPGEVAGAFGTAMGELAAALSEATAEVASWSAQLAADEAACASVVGSAACAKIPMDEQQLQLAQQAVEQITQAQAQAQSQQTQAQNAAQQAAQADTQAVATQERADAQIAILDQQMQALAQQAGEQNGLAGGIGEGNIDSLTGGKGGISEGNNHFTGGISALQALTGGMGNSFSNILSSFRNQLSSLFSGLFNRNNLFEWNGLTQNALGLTPLMANSAALRSGGALDGKALMELLKQLLAQKQGLMAQANQIPEQINALQEQSQQIQQQIPQLQKQDQALNQESQILDRKVKFTLKLPSKFSKVLPPLWLKGSPCKPWRNRCKVRLLPWKGIPIVPKPLLP